MEAADTYLTKIHCTQTNFMEILSQTIEACSLQGRLFRLSLFSLLYWLYSGFPSYTDYTLGFPPILTILWVSLLYWLYSGFPSYTDYTLGFPPILTKLWVSLLYWLYSGYHKGIFNAFMSQRITYSYFYSLGYYFALTLHFHIDLLWLSEIWSFILEDTSIIHIFNPVSFCGTFINIHKLPL